MEKLYYTPPIDKQFDELKAKAIEVWKELNSHPTYENEKVGRIENMGNVGDNFMTIVAMFDTGNQGKLVEKLSLGTRRAVRERMIDGGNPEYLIMF